jgi:hypothetical protein
VRTLSPPGAPKERIRFLPLLCGDSSRYRFGSAVSQRKHSESERKSRFHLYGLSPECAGSSGTLDENGSASGGDFGGRALG